MIQRPPISTLTDTLFPYTTLFRSHVVRPKSKIGMVALGATVQVSLPPPKRFDRPILIVPATAVSDILGKKAARAAPMLALAARSRLSASAMSGQLGRASCRERVCQYV